MFVMSYKSILFPKKIKKIMLSIWFTPIALLS